MRRVTSALTAAVLVAGVVAFSPSPTATDDNDPTAYVDPLVGSTPPGFTNPGPVLPHGMASPGPDTEGPLAYGGYYAHNQLITGFSQTHMSAGVYQAGVFPIMPVVGEVPPGDLAQAGYVQPVPAYSSPFSLATQTAVPGHYRVVLDRGAVLHEITATERVALHRSLFPSAGTGRMVLDVARSLKGYRPSRLTRVDERTFLVEVDQNGPDHTVFGAIRLDQDPTEVATLDDATVAVGDTVPDTGVVVDVPGAGLETRIGLSFTDAQGALRNLETEAAFGEVSFDGAVAAADAAWEEALGQVEVTSQTDVLGGAPTPRADLDKVRLYTALYHHRLFPNLHSDVDGRHRGPDDRVHIDTERPRYSQFSLWDSYRGQNALLAVLDPDRYEDMLHSLAAFADHNDGVLPRWQLGPENPGYMSGDPATMFITTGVCRGIGDDELVEELLGDVQVLRERREPELADLGYLPTAQPAHPGELPDGGGRDGGKTLEYGVADAAAALLASAAGEDDLAAEIAADSLYYRELLDPETGYVRPRDATGAFVQGGWDPMFGYGFQEGTSHQYTWLAMHDWVGMVQRMGGDAAAQQKLDRTMGLPLTAGHGLPWGTVQNEVTAFGVFYFGDQFAPGNEHDLEIPYAYNAAGAPWKTQAAARAAASVYTATADGLPGNDDLGALSGWLVWTLLGVHPTIPGAPVYLVGSPTFPHATIHTPTGDLVIDAPGASEQAKYLTSPMLGGEPLERTWFTEDEWRDGAFAAAMSPVPDTTWGTSIEARPPSVANADLGRFGCRH